MGARWEYATLSILGLQRDADGWGIFSIASGGPPIESTGGERKENDDRRLIGDWEVNDALDKMGELGWELVGPPEVNRLADSYEDGVTLGDPVAKTFYFKRPKAA